MPVPSTCCGLLLSCGRPALHRGHCGGLTRVVAVPADQVEISVAIDVHLTPKQVQVLVALVDDETRDAAAYRLGMSEHTLDNHLTQIFRVLDVGTLLAAYRRLGWLRVGQVAA